MYPFSVLFSGDAQYVSISGSPSVSLHGHLCVQHRRHRLQVSCADAKMSPDSAFYIGGIFFYKWGLEFFNGSITTLATDRFKASNAFTKLGAAQGINQAAQCGACSPS